MHGATRIKITDLNARLTCKLCGGYYIDATTIVECLHSFCKACIVKYLENNKYCPVCEVQVHKTKPLLNIKSDTTLQDMVYKLVPGLFKSEMKRRRDFWAAHPDEYALIMDPEDRGEVHENRFIYIPHEDINLCLEYWDGESEVVVVPNGGGDQMTKNEDQSEEKSEGSDEALEKSHRRFLRAPAAVTITHLKKFIRFKYGFPANYVIDLVYESEVLSDDYTLIDVAYIYSWRRNGPMKLRYRIQDPKISNPTKKLKTSHHSDANSDASTNPTLPPPLLPAPNGNKSAGPATSSSEEAAATKSVNVNAKSHSANKSNCPPPSQPTTHTPLSSVDDKQKSAAAGETPCRTSTPMEVDLRPSSVTFTPIVTPLVNGNSTSSGVENDKLGLEVVNISGKDNNKAVVEIMIKSSVTIEPVMDKSPTMTVANDKDTRPFSIHTPEPPTQEVIITKVIADDNSSSITSRTPTPKDSIEIKPTKIVPISTKDVTVKEITTTTSSSAPTLPNDNSTKDGGNNNNSVVVVVLASKEPPEIPVTTNSGNCHSSGGGGGGSVSTSPPVHLPVPDISITPIPLWTTTTPTSSPNNNNATLTPAAPRSSTSAAIVRDTLRTTNPQVEIIKKVSVTENGSSTPATSFTPSITTVTPVVMNCNGSNNVGSSPSITFSPSSTTIITTSATDTTMTITITSTPVKPSTSTPTVSSTSLTPVTVTTTTTSTAGHVESSGNNNINNNNGGGGGDDDDPPKHDNIGALDLSRNSRGSHSPQSPRSPRSFAAAPSPASASTNGGCMLPPVSTMCFTTPPPSLRLPTQTQVRSVTSKSLTLSSAGAASITTITVPNAHSRVLPVVTAPTCSSPHHAHSPHAQVQLQQQQHPRSSHLPINSVHLSALKPSARNCLNGVVSAVNARSLQLQQQQHSQQQQQQHHHHHHHHNLHHPHTHGPQQLQTQSTQQQQQPTSHHFQNRATFAKNIITPFGASKAAKKPEQVRHRTSFDKSPIIPNSNAFHNGDKVIESGASATTTI